MPLITYNKSRAFAICSCLGITNVTSHQTNARIISRGVFNAISMTWALVSGFINVSVFSTIFHRMLDQKPDLTEPYRVKTACFHSPRAISSTAIHVEKKGDIQLNRKSGNNVNSIRISSSKRITAEKANCVGIGAESSTNGWVRSKAHTPKRRERASFTLSKRFMVPKPAPITWSVVSSQ